MAYSKSFALAFTTAADGSATVRSGVRVNGRIQEVTYTYGDALTGADFTVTGNTTSRAVLTITNAGTSTITWKPREVIHPIANTGAGTALTYDGTRPIYESFWLVDEEIKLVVASGGDSKTGTLTFIVG